ncbi:MAG: hypothetical protein ACLUOI_12450 [Eisenbergiella sp.]
MVVLDDDPTGIRGAWGVCLYGCGDGEYSGGVLGRRGVFILIEFQGLGEEETGLHREIGRKVAAAAEELGWSFACEQGGFYFEGALSAETESLRRGLKGRCSCDGEVICPFLRRAVGHGGDVHYVEMGTDGWFLWGDGVRKDSSFGYVSSI